MEEARQHPALVRAQIPLAVIYFGGLLAIVLGIVGQFTLGGRSLHVGLLAFVWSKVVISAWSLVHPASVPGKQARPIINALVLVGWLAFGVVLSMPLLGDV